MLFLYSDDGSRFKDNKIPHKMKYGLVSVLKGGHLIQVKITKKEEDKTATLAAAVNRGGRLIQVKTLYLLR